MHTSAIRDSRIDARPLPAVTIRHANRSAQARRPGRTLVVLGGLPGGARRPRCAGSRRTSARAPFCWTRSR